MKKIKYFIPILLVGSFGVYWVFTNTEKDLHNNVESYLSSDTKLNIDEQGDSITRILSSNKPEYLIKKGTKLNLLLTPTCFQEQSSRRKKQQNEFELQKLKFSFPVGYKSLVFTVKEEILASELNARFSKNPCILKVGNRRRAVLSGTDPLIYKQTHYKEFQSNEFLAKLSQFESRSQSNVVVAVIDSGIDIKHPDLINSLWTNKNETLNSTDDDQNAYADDIHGYDFASRVGDPTHKGTWDHGTHVAGLIAATADNGIGIRSIASHNLELMILNVTGKYNGAMTEDIEEAIYYAINNGANIINISLGSKGRADNLAHAILQAVQHGILVVSSAGNDASSLDNMFYFPASYAPEIPGFISVGAYEVISKQLCSDSNYSASFVKILAPGCDSNNPGQGIFSTRANSSYGYLKGTSMAAPIVSGAAAILYSHFCISGNTSNCPQEIEKSLIENSRSIRKLDTKVQYGKIFDLSFFNQML